MRDTIPANFGATVAAGSRASLRYPIGMSYHNTQLSYTGFTPAQATNVKFNLNSRTHLEFASLAQLDVLNQFDGMPAAAGTVTLDFERYNITSPVNRDLTILGTGISGDPAGLDNITLEFDIAPATTPAITAKHVVSEPQKTGFIRKIRDFTFQHNAAGTLSHVNIDRKAGLLNKLYMNSALITAVEIRADRKTVWERTVAENTYEQVRHGIRVPQAGYFVIDFTENGDGSEARPVEQYSEFEIRVTVSAPVTIPVKAEFVGSVEK